jgi:beta-lactamase regulating signal transducer with metallopeptidase domain
VTFLLDCALRASVVLSVALAALLLMRRQSAALRHSVLAAAIVCSLAVPVIALVVPAWEFVYLKLPSNRSAAIHTRIENPENLQARTAEPLYEAVPVAPSVVESAIQPASEPNAQIRVPQYIGWLWGAGAILFAFVLSVGWFRLLIIATRSESIVRSAWIQSAEHISRQYGLRRRVRLLQSKSPTLLATWGLLFPKIVLPESAGDWHGERIDVVLRHELAHVRRQDWLVLIAAELLRVMYWFNPLVWMACSRLRRESEQAADDHVLRSGLRGPDYAAHLLELAKTLQGARHAWSLALSMASESTLEARFKALLNPDLDRRTLTRVAILATVFTCVAVTLPITALRVSAQEVLSLDLPINVLRAPFALLARSTPPQQTDVATADATIEGMVVRFDTGEPLAGAHIELSTPGARAASRNEATGPDGRFEFTNIAAGEYRLVAAREGGYLPAEYGQRSPGGRGISIKLLAGSRFRNARLSLVQPGAISGRVVDADGEPVGRAQVQAMRTVYGNGRQSEMIAASVATDDRGIYRLYWLPPGQYRVSAMPPDSSNASIPIFPKSLDTAASFYTLFRPPVVMRRVLETGEIREEVQVPTFFPGTSDWQSATPVEVRASGNVEGIEIRVAPPVRTHHVRGTLISGETGQPLSGVPVMLTPLDAANSFVPEAKSDRNGNFDISGALAGAYSLTSPLYLRNTDSPLSGSFPMTVGSNDLDNVVVVLSPGFDIPVRVTLEGRPISHAGLTLRLTTYPSRGPFGEITRPGSPQWNLLATSEFALKGVAPGDYQISFVGIGGSLEAAEAYVKSMRMGSTDLLANPLHVDGPPQNPIEIVIGTDVSALDGTVFNDKHEPLENVDVAVIPALQYRGRTDLFKTGTTDATGHFHIPAIAPGDYRVFAWENVERFAWQDPQFLQAYEARGQSVHIAQGKKETIEINGIK